MFLSQLHSENGAGLKTSTPQPFFARKGAGMASEKEPSTATTFFPSIQSQGKAARPSENLRSERFSGNQQLEAAFDNSPPLKRGHSGDGVALVQQSLIEDGFDMPISTARSGSPDGIFGSETFKATVGFQNKHFLQQDGMVGHNTLDKMEAIMETKDGQPVRAAGSCTGIKAFGKDFANAIDIVISNIPPSAGPRGNAPNDIMFKTGGVGGNAIFEINANASLSPQKLGDRFEHGVIQTTKTMKFLASYSNGKSAFRESANSRDAEPNTREPWVRNAPAKGGPVPFFAGNKANKGFVLKDLPQHFFPKKHPKHPSSEIEKIDFKTIFNFWHIAKKPTTSGKKMKNLVFMSNFQMTLESNAVKSKVNSNFIGNTPNYRLTKSISCGQGTETPVLNTPITILELKKLHF